MVFHKTVDYNSRAKHCLKLLNPFENTSLYVYSVTYTIALSSDDNLVIWNPFWGKDFVNLSNTEFSLCEQVREFLSCPIWNGSFPVFYVPHCPTSYMVEHREIIWSTGSQTPHSMPISEQGCPFGYGIFPRITRMHFCACTCAASSQVLGGFSL